MFQNGYGLKAYQSEDLQRLCDREAGELVSGITSNVGFILAYYMGLGKTVLTLALICSRPKTAESLASPATLAVCPNVGVMSHWRSEINKFAPHLNCLWYHEKGRDSDPGNADVVLVTYAQVATQHRARLRYIEEYKKTHSNAMKHDESKLEGPTQSRVIPPIKLPPGLCPLFTCHFHRVVLDEAHLIRNPESKGAAACCDLKKSHGLCLTGTPAQNSLRDFFTLFKFLEITISGINSLETFRKLIYTPIQQGRPERAYSLLLTILSHFMIHRPLVPPRGGIPLLILPKRHAAKVICIKLTPEERLVYEYIEDRHHFAHEFTKIIRLRQACDHPFLLCKALKPEDADTDMTSDDMRAGFDNDSDFAAKNSADSPESRGVLLTPRALPKDLLPVRELFDDRYASSKMTAVHEIVCQIRRDRQGEKIIIFSHFTTVLSLIGEVLDEQNISFTSYTGSMNSAERECALERIATDKDCAVILISIMAGESGLNIVACNNVILMEPWWNPFVEEQAISRVHRIGQTREVHVYRMVVDQSIENYIIETQKEKRKTIGKVLDQCAIPVQHNICPASFNSQTMKVSP